MSSVIFLQYSWTYWSVELGNMTMYTVGSTFRDSSIPFILGYPFKAPKNFKFFLQNITNIKLKKYIENIVLVLFIKS